jgi:hypothetical protein
MRNKLVHCEYSTPHADYCKPDVSAKPLETDMITTLITVKGKLASIPGNPSGMENDPALKSLWKCIANHLLRSGQMSPTTRNRSGLRMNEKGRNHIHHHLAIKGNIP